MFVRHIIKSVSMFVHCIQDFNYFSIQLEACFAEALLFVFYCSFFFFNQREGRDDIDEI